jgi:zinc transport system permease protein
MAAGILFVSLAPGYAPDLMSYLFGSLLFVSWDYVWVVAALDIAIGLAVHRLFADFQAVCFDEEFSEVVGLPVERLFVVLLALTALGIVTLIRVVGVILVIALLTVPAAIGRHWADDLRRMMLVATGVAVACTASGLLLSYGLADLSGLRPGVGISMPPGPLIVLIAAALYGLSSLLRRATRRA